MMNLSMVLYGINLDPLSEELLEADPGVLTQFCTYDAALNGLAWRSAQLLRLLMDGVADRKPRLPPPKTAK